jgi:hypothetical protein
MSDFCIVGSAPLELAGIRPSTDIDITLTSERRKPFGSGITKLSANVDVVTEGYHRRLDGATVTDDMLIHDTEFHFIYRGFKFANPDIILDRKTFSRRDKDLKDIELAKRAANSKKRADFNPQMELNLLNEITARNVMPNSKT